MSMAQSAVFKAAENGFVPPEFRAEGITIPFSTAKVKTLVAEFIYMYIYTYTIYESIGQADIFQGRKRSGFKAGFA
jgi:hypothetical protein